MPFLQRGRSGDVSSYMKLVNWLFRKYSDEQSLGDQVVQYDGASQEDDETENGIYVRIRGLGRLWVYPHRLADEEPLYAGARLGD